MSYRNQGRDLNYRAACVAFYVLLTDLFGVSIAETQGAEKEEMAHLLFSGEITCCPKCHKITDHYRYEEQVASVNNATCTHPAKGPNCVICLHVIIGEWVESARRARGLLCVESY